MKSDQSRSARYYVLRMASAVALLFAALAICTDQPALADKAAPAAQAASGKVGDTEFIRPQEVPLFRPQRQSYVALKNKRSTKNNILLLPILRKRSTCHAHIGNQSYPAPEHTLSYVQVRTHSPRAPPSSSALIVQRPA